MNFQTVVSISGLCKSSGNNSAVLGASKLPVLGCR